MTIPILTDKQPVVTKTNIKNELEYWLSQIPPDQLLEILSDKFHEIGIRQKNKAKRVEWAALSQMMSAISHVTFVAWNR